MVNLPPIVGNINPVPIPSYKEIIDNYVNKVDKIEQVASIVQMGSFTKPGISDIDLIITLRDNMPYPQWSEISLKDISDGHKHAEVIAHDIFVIPENIAQQAEAYFYIDHQNVLKGKRLGGNFTRELIDKFKEFLALEYALFSLDSITGILLSDKVDLRNLSLLISSMRHSAALAFSMDTIAKEEKDAIISRVEKLRTDILCSNYSVEEFSYLFEKFINLLVKTIKYSLKKLNKEIITGQLKKSWIVGSRTAMIGVSDQVDYLTYFLGIIERQKNRFASKYTKLLAVPVESQMHIGAYLDGNERAAVYFRNNFKTLQPFHDENVLNTQARKIRGEIVRSHWNFIDKTGYLKSSGRSYCGLSYPGEKSYKTFLRKALLYYHLRNL